MVLHRTSYLMMFGVIHELMEVKIFRHFVEQIVSLDSQSRYFLYFVYQIVSYYVQGIYTCEIIAFYIFTKFSLPSFFRGSILVAAKPGDIYRGLLAQPPRTVSGRAYELSLRLPLTLRVMLLPRSQIWADLFQNDYPDLNDIALYFSPDDKIERFVLTSDFYETISASASFYIFIFKGICRLYLQIQREHFLPV